VVKDVIALTRHLIHTNEVHLHILLDDSLPWVSMDHNQMKQVLLNLIHNALQAMPGGGELTLVTTALKRDERDWVMMSVKDSGEGITPADQHRIFEPFFTTKGDHGGTGLGLSVTYGIVTDHGGTIEVTSEKNNGSTFSVYLPL
jgi:two-component system, NtrC family, sensor kinase